MSLTFPQSSKELPCSILGDFGDCRKKSITIKAQQIDCEFRVCTLEGDYAQGKDGDYLMEGVEGELYICAKDIFEKKYDWLPMDGREEGKR